ncbi:hypothetical protein T440DRAFT_480317 [Plenodomus tracheiphilus IPT5]|uniref:Uncharacterized protein n=1 Tax=Plenodomus tracheiphilus IPT5 TaxID=1408161 RepID=A0A6A7B494_9PLEO|nr:hypothetical protein T440DRAFT_480317 [Plenodomus tracheiphilus IPT5]
MTSSPFLALPRELRDEVVGYLTLPAYVYTSSTTTDTDTFGRSRRGEKTYIDTRIYLPSRLPANILATCRQLRHECLDHHAHRLNSNATPISAYPSKKPMSAILAERLGTEFMEDAERACDDQVPRVTIEVGRRVRGAMGYAVPTRDELSPRFLALLPLMQRARKLRVDVWPDYEWWNGGPQPLTDKYGNLRASVPQVSNPNTVTVAIGRILEQLPYVEELMIDVLMQGSEGGRWDLPDRKWENIQPWLDTPITVRGQTLKKLTRRLTAFAKSSVPEPFYTQLETHKGAGPLWKVERKGDMLTPTLRSYCIEPEDLEYFASLVIEESFERIDRPSPDEPSIVSHESRKI